MSWLFSRVLVEECLGGSSWDGEPFAELNVMPTQRGFWHRDKMTDVCQLSLFGQTWKPLTEEIGGELLKSFRRGFPVRISVSRIVELRGSKGSGVDCGPKWSGSFARFNPSSFSWKTRQLSLFGGLEEFSETWPAWGLMQGGECWELKTPEGVMRGNGGGVLPTPLASDWKGGTNQPHSKTGKLRDDQFRHWLKIHFGLTYPIPAHSEAVMGWPIGWSDFKPLEMDKFRWWQEWHGKSYQGKGRSK